LRRKDYSLDKVNAMSSSSVYEAYEAISYRLVRLSCVSAIAIGILCSMTACSDNLGDTPFRRRMEAEKSNKAAEGKVEAEPKTESALSESAQAEKAEGSKEGNQPEASKPEVKKPEVLSVAAKAPSPEKKTPEQIAKEQQQQAERDAVESATTRWLATVTSGRPNAAEEVMKLYADDAILLGTVSEQVRDTRAEIKTYFEYFTKLQKLSVSGYRSFIRVYGDTAINSGYYTFSYEKEGHTKVVPARYTFSYRRINGKWLIEDHHSSAIPKAPEKLAPAID
jgi:uncharacterized protein (TIGR02246 family)